MKRVINREQIVLAVTLLVFVLLLAMGGVYLFRKHQWAQEQLTTLTPRYARLLGLEAHQEELERTAKQAQELLAQYVYPVTQDVSQAGNDAQQRIRTIFSGAGLDIVSSQVLTPKTEKNFDRIPLAVRVEGQLLALQTALVALGGQTPVIVVDGFTVQTIGAVKADKPQRLGVQFNLSVLREHP